MAAPRGAVRKLRCARHAVGVYGWRPFYIWSNLGFASPRNRRGLAERIGPCPGRLEGLLATVPRPALAPLLASRYLVKAAPAVILFGRKDSHRLDVMTSETIAAASAEPARAPCFIGPAAAPSAGLGRSHATRLRARRTRMPALPGPDEADRHDHGPDGDRGDALPAGSRAQSSTALPGAPVARARSLARRAPMRTALLSP